MSLLTELPVEGTSVPTSLQLLVLQRPGRIFKVLNTGIHDSISCTGSAGMRSLTILQTSLFQIRKKKGQSK